MAGAAAERTKLKHILQQWCGADATSDAAYGNDPLKLAMDAKGVDGLPDFTLLSKADFESLDYDDAGTMTPLPLTSKRKLQCASAYFHHASRNAGGPINVTGVPTANYDSFRISLFSPASEIVPWGTPISTAGAATPSDLWKKSVKPNASAFKQFREEVHWSKFKDSFETTLESQGLQELIDSTHVPADAAADLLKKKWLFKIMQDTMLAPHAKAIVQKHLAQKDTRAIWKEVTDHYSGSMVSQIRSQTISSYITSVRLHSSNWRGSQSNFVLHFAEQCRLYNEITEPADNYSDGMKIQFLNAAVAGTPNLSGVLFNRRTAIKAATAARGAAPVAGGGAPPAPPAVTFDEYVADLLDAASVYDSGITTTRSRRSAHKTELEFDDGSFQVDDAHEDLQANAHEFDIDTPLELIVHQASSRSSSMPSNEKRRVFMNRDTWRSLKKDDQEAWDRVSEEGKQSILGYVARKAASKDTKQSPFG